VDRSHINDLIVDDRKNGIFRIHRSVFTEPAILEIERRELFDRCWLYAGHESEIAKPGSFLTRSVGGRPLLLVRDERGKVQVLLNSCAHRGNIVCRETSGTARAFTCFYHAWTYNLRGELIGLPDEDGYAPAFNRQEMGLKPVPRFETYRGMIFVCFDRNAVDLVTYLGPVREYLDLTLDFSDAEDEILEGTQAFSMRANWKLLIENSIDPYHLRSTHRRYFQQFLPDMGIDSSKWSDWDTGIGIALDGGHSLFECPMLPTPLSESAKAELGALRARLTTKFGAERTHQIADYMRNIFIFPNLILVPIWRSVRTFYPVAPDYLEVTEWALMPRNESQELRQRRIGSFMSFLGPAGFGTPDDVAGLEGCQRGYATVREHSWSDLSRYMLSEVAPGDGELQHRSFWRRWRALASGETGVTNCTDRLELRPAAE
jgi:phenylpropionate dioxygenase-like ring-hydroxylating dioxygenase large terminal subunit